MTAPFDIIRDVPARLRESTGLDSASSAATGPNEWADPVELPSGLKPVALFDDKFLPRNIAPWVQDISDRMQYPPDFVAVPAVTALGAAIGRKLGISPQRQTDWVEVPNFWGCIVGRPGAMKSPAMEEALKPLKSLDAEARRANEAALKNFAAEQDAFELRKQHTQKKAKDALSSGGDISSMLRLDRPDAPKSRRFIVNDCTYEALGEILADNPTGVLACRDELVSLLKTLDREEYAPARGFFLTAWNGTSEYTFDRIVRGRTHIEAACVSLLGSTQPGRIAEYIRRANVGGAGDDGLIQRFGLLVWPDQSSEWKNVDRYPDGEARQSALETFRRLSDLTPASVAAERNQYQSIAFLRFGENAQRLFADWRKNLELRLRSGELHPAMESHLAKYRKLVPTLALVNHLTDNGTGPVDEMSTWRAIQFSEYLETHARRAYAAGSEAEVAAAKAILNRIRKGDLSSGFTARDISQRDWANLTDRDHIQAGLSLLADCDWIAARRIETGGRPKIVHWINPRASQ
jgi:putative DNA primase/helicase